MNFDEKLKLLNEAIKDCETDLDLLEDREQIHDLAQSISGDPLQTATALLGVVAERDAATKRADEIDEKWARAIAEALMTTFHPRADNSVEVWAAHVRREHEAHTRKDDLFRKACEQRDALRTELAAAQAKLATLLKAAKGVDAYAKPYEPEDLLDPGFKPPLARLREAIAAAERRDDDLSKHDDHCNCERCR